MQSEFFLALRIFALLGFACTIAVGIWMAKNYQRLFGVDGEMPSENSSSRAYTQVQIFTLWAHVLVATAAFALFLH